MPGREKRVDYRESVFADETGAVLDLGRELGTGCNDQVDGFEDVVRGFQAGGGAETGAVGLAGPGGVGDGALDGGHRLGYQRRKRRQRHEDYHDKGQPKPAEHSVSLGGVVA